MGYHIDELNIEAFRGLRNVRLPQLGRINLFVGENNSGKTSVLEAVGGFCSPLNPRYLLNAVAWREAFPWGEPFFYTLEWLFPHSSLRMELFEGHNVIKGEGAFPARRVQVDYERRTRVLGLSPLTEQSGASLSFNVEALINEEESTTERKFEIWDNEPFAMTAQPRELFLPHAMISPFTHRYTNLLAKELSKKATDNAKKPIVDLLQKLDRDITDLQVWAPSEETATVYIEHRETGVTPVSAFGDGIRRALAIAVGFPYNGVLLIDEIESSLHASALSSVFRWLVETCERENVQLFATTHSLEALDTLLDEDVSGKADLVGYRLNRSGSQIHAERFGRDTLERLRYERGLDVRL